MGQNNNVHREKLYAQIEEAYGKVVYTYTTQIIHAGRVAKRNNIIKWLQIILSAVATGGFIFALVKSQVISVVVGGLASTMLLIISTYIKDANLETLVGRHIDTSNRLWIVREEYVSLMTDFDELDENIIATRRDELQKKVAIIYGEAPLTDSRSYSIAQETLKNKGAQFFEREELNKMLPHTLRQ